jgi:hypothetical protein
VATAVACAVHLGSLSAPCVELVGDNDAVTVLDELQQLDRHTLERLKEGIPEAPRRCLATVDACLETTLNASSQPRARVGELVCTRAETQLIGVDDRPRTAVDEAVEKLRQLRRGASSRQPAAR